MPTAAPPGPFRIHPGMQQFRLAKANFSMTTSSRITAPFLRRMLLVAALPLLLAGCSNQDMHGTATPPDEFGAMDGAFFGCPSMQGMYAWPPEAGMYSDGIASNEQPWAGMTPVPIGRGRMQVWVLESGQMLTMLSRDTPADGNTDPGHRRGWGYAEHYGLACHGDMLDGDDEEIGDGREYGCEGLRRGFRLARMADGALAVGIRKVAHGCRDSVVTWGDRSAGEMKTPDKVYWQWSKLRRIGDGTPSSAAGS